MKESKSDYRSSPDITSSAVKGHKGRTHLKAVNRTGEEVPRGNTQMSVSISINQSQRGVVSGRGQGADSVTEQ